MYYYSIVVLVADSLKSAKCYIAQRHVHTRFMFNLVNKMVNTEPVTYNNNIIMEHMVYTTQFYVIAHAQRTHHCLCVFT